MKFSIITCTWNSIDFIKYSVESVLSQTYQNTEFIFVDGGSTDGTIEYLEQIDHPKKIIHGIQGGISRAMNHGTQTAGGDVVMHLHSDDYLLHPRVLERAAHIFTSQNCAWLIGRILNERDGGLYPESYIPPAYTYHNLLRSNFIPHAATFVSRSLYQQAGGFSEKLRFAMDYDMWLRLGRIATPCATKEVFSVFRRHAESTTEKNRLHSFDEDHAVRKKYLAEAHAGLVQKSLHEIRYLVRRRKLQRLLHESAPHQS